MKACEMVKNYVKGVIQNGIKLSHLAIIIFVCLAGLGFTMGMIEATNQSTFCGTACHEMDPEYVTWQHSGHRNVACAECHEKPGLVGTVQSKWKGTKELVMHVTGNYETPIKMANPNDVDCYQCHQDKMKENTELAASLKDPHTMKHFENGMNCLTCHSGVVHDDSKNMAMPSRDRCYTCHLNAMSELKK